MNLSWPLGGRPSANPYPQAEQPHCCQATPGAEGNETSVFEFSKLSLKGQGVSCFYLLIRALGRYISLERVVEGFKFEVDGFRFRVV